MSFTTHTALSSVLFHPYYKILLSKQLVYILHSVLSVLMLYVPYVTEHISLCIQYFGSDF